MSNQPPYVPGPPEQPYGPPPEHWAGATPEPAPKKNGKGWLVALALALGLVLLCLIGTLIVRAFGSDDPAGRPAVTTTKGPASAAAKPAATQQAEAPNGAQVDGAVALLPGDYDVGAKFDVARKVIKPGTYTIGAEGACYWERVRNWDQDLSSIITNGNVMGSATAKVTVKRTDKGLHLGDGCVAAITTK